MKGIVKKILAKGEIIKLETDDGIIDFEVKPLRNDELMETLELFEEKKNKEGMNKLLKITLEKTDPDVTIDDIKRLPLSVYVQFLKTILKVNKLEEMLEIGTKKGMPDTAKKILDRLSSVKSSKEKMKTLNQKTE